MYPSVYREVGSVSIWLVCDRCQREVRLDANEMPDGWFRPTLSWPGDEQDVCKGCLTLTEQQALAADPVEDPR